MTKEELIGYCRYYKGERECPFERFSNRETFWQAESMYVDLASEDDEWRKGMEADAARYRERLRGTDSLLADSAVSVHTKGIALYVFGIVAKWIPYDIGIVTEY